jgi:hypothetical protein
MTMSSLAETISTALRRVGCDMEGRLHEIMADFQSLSLTDEERLVAVATTIATTARTHHHRHTSVYLDAVRTWSLEIAAELEPPPIRVRYRIDEERVADAVDILTSGIDALIELMGALGTRIQDRLVTELAIVSRLLGQVDASVIHMTLREIGRALESSDFEPGTLLMLPLRETTKMIDRGADLALLQPRGCA